MEIHSSEYFSHNSECNGYCENCDEITNFGSVEPDAREYQCDICGEMSVMGIEEAMIDGQISVEFTE